MSSHRVRTALLYLGALLLCLYFVRPAFDWFNGKGGANDWDAQTFYLEAAVRPVLDYGRRPVWNPWYGGGLPQAANPQVKLYSPTWFAALIVGSVAAHKLAIIFYYLAGTLGMMFLLRNVLRLRGPAALGGTVLFMFSGSMPLRMIAGHATFLCILLYPPAAALFIRCATAGPRSLRAFAYGMATAMLLALMYSEGHFPVMLLLPGAGFAAAIHAILLRRARVAWRFALVIGLFVLLAAHRLVPQLEYMLDQGAFLFPDDSWISPDGLRAIFLDAASNPVTRKWVGQKYLWWEYGTYIGPVSLIVAPLLLPFARRRYLPLALALIFILLLVMGRFAVGAPANLLGLLPLYEHLRCWARFAPVAVLCWAVLYALMMHRALVFASKRGRGETRGGVLSKSVQVIAWIVLAWSFYDLRIINTKHLRNVFTLEIPRGPTTLSNDASKGPGKGPTTITRLPSYGATSSMLPAMRRNLATRDAYEMLKSNRSLPARGEKNYRGEYHLAGDGTRVLPTQWFPDRLEFDLTIVRGDTLIINRNYHQRMRATNGFSSRNHGGIIAVKLKPGRNRFAVYYDDTISGLLLCLSMLLQGGFVIALVYYTVRK